MNKRALIIGVTGQDGSYLAQLLLSKGYEVYGASRDHESGNFYSNLRRLGIDQGIVPCSLNPKDFRSVLTGIKSIQPDEIYNLSGQTSVALSFLQPVEAFESISIATLNILECLRILDIDTKFYCAGSSEVFGNTITPATESTLFDPRSPYATAKCAAYYTVSNYREAYGLKACTGLLFNHESPLRSPRFVTQKIVKTAVRISKGINEVLELGNIYAERDWGWAPEYVEAMWLMLQQNSPEDIIIATGESHKLISFIDLIFKLLGLDWRDHVKTDPKHKRPSDIDVSQANPAKALSVLGWRANLKMADVARMLIEAEQTTN